MIIILEFNCMDEYFAMKTEYENKIAIRKKKILQDDIPQKEKLKKIKKMKPKCIYCKRPVGSLFYLKDNTYIAKCGDTNEPCALDIKIYRGKYAFPIYEIDNIIKEISILEKEMIHSKLNAMYKLIPKNESDFDDIKSKYLLLQKKLSDMIELQVTKNEIIDKLYDRLNKIKAQLQTNILEYESSKDMIHLRANVELYSEEILPIFHELNEKKNLVLTEDKGIYIMKQDSISNNLEYTEESMNVLNFSKKKNKKNKTTKSTTHSQA